MKGRPHIIFLLNLLPFIDLFFFYEDNTQKANLIIMLTF